MKITSAERSTGMGARHETQVFWDFRWYAVSTFPEAKHVNRRDGFEIWELEWDHGPETVRAYHRSNSGTVAINASHMCAGFAYDDVEVKG